VASVSFRALGNTLRGRLTAARRLGAFGGTTALSRLGRPIRTLSAARVVTVGVGSVVGGALGGDDDGRGTGAGTGVVPCGEAHATTASMTAAIFMRQSFAVAHTASIALTRAGGRIG
jgi:hypothetical protein